MKEETYNKGYNVYQYLNAFYKRSKLVEKLPKEVEDNACRAFLSQAERQHIKQPFVYFLALIKKHSAQHHADRNQKINKKEPMILGDILNGIQRSM